jgi:hypothetical protein
MPYVIHTSFLENKLNENRFLRHIVQIFISLNLFKETYSKKGNVINSTRKKKLRRVEETPILK